MVHKLHPHVAVKTWPKPCCPFCNSQSSMLHSQVHGFTVYADTQVQQLLSEEAQERTSVADLQHQLVDLQSEVNAAHEQLHLTQARVDQNVQRVADLKSEAAQLELMRHLTQADGDAQVQPHAHNQHDSQHHERISAHATASTSTATQTQAAANTFMPNAAARSAPLQRGTVAARQRGLQSSLEIEEGLKSFWYPATFSSQLQKDTPVAFELFGQPWVLFRNKSGEPACVRDTCAHRACPLSLGKVIDGNIQCAYHGWQYDERGQCVSMPSTISCPNVGVSSMSCKEKDGFVLVWPGQGQEPAVPSLAPPSGFDIHAEIEVCSSVDSPAHEAWSQVPYLPVHCLLQLCDTKFAAHAGVCFLCTILQAISCLQSSSCLSAMHRCNPCRVLAFCCKTL